MSNNHIKEKKRKLCIFCSILFEFLPDPGTMIGNPPVLLPNNVNALLKLAAIHGSTSVQPQSQNKPCDPAHMTSDPPGLTYATSPDSSPSLEGLHALFVLFCSLTLLCFLFCLRRSFDWVAMYNLFALFVFLMHVIWYLKKLSMFRKWFASSQKKKNCHNYTSIVIQLVLTLLKSSNLGEFNQCHTNLSQLAKYP